MLTDHDDDLEGHDHPQSSPGAKCILRSTEDRSLSIA
jgi:hypothetical protein